MRNYFQTDLPVRFLFPIDGDCLNGADAAESVPAGDPVPVAVSVAAPAGHTVTVSGIPATEAEAGVYRATVPVPATVGETVLTAKDLTDGTASSVTVHRLARADERRYRISSDDNIRFLKELNERNYASIFDHAYLAVYKEAHDRYGAKVHLNLFYEFDEKARSYFLGDHAHFDLSMMTDRYREEFRANADWLSLAFHAKSEFPPAPYKFADGETVTRDYRAVIREIERFAGPECIPDTTTVHFGEANEEGVTALRALGIRSLTGYFELHHGKPCVSYYAPPDLLLHVGARDFWIDRDTDMLFGRIDRVLNIGPLESVCADVEAAANDPHRGGFVSIMIHEQYFYEDYRNYLPDFRERVLRPAKYLYEHGYVGAQITR